MTISFMTVLDHPWFMSCWLHKLEEQIVFALDFTPGLAKVTRPPNLPQASGFCFFPLQHLP